MSQIHDHAFWLKQDQELDWNQQLYIGLAFWLEQEQELEPTESVTQGAWIRFGAGTTPDVYIPVSNWNKIWNRNFQYTVWMQKLFVVLIPDV